MEYTILNRDELPRYGSTYEFQGYQFGDTNISFIMIVDMLPGDGPRLHQHPYEEIFIIQEGQATFTIGATTLEAHAGQIAIVPPNTPHKFVNTGPGPLKQLDIHCNPKFITIWLEDQATS